MGIFVEIPSILDDRVFSLLVVVWFIFSHWSIAILDRDVLDDWLVVLLVVPFSTEVVGVVVWDKVRVSVLIHHWDKLRLKRLNIVDDDRILSSFWNVILYWLMDNRMRRLVEWSDILD